MLKIDNPADCCGCTACASICVHDAIVMKPDVLGFLYPKVDKEKCIDCGLCEKVCQFKKGYNRYQNFENPQVIALRSKDVKDLRLSQSGSAFYLLAHNFIEQGGVVYGAGYESVYKVKHKRIDTIEGLQELRGSKYTQSDICGIFKQVKDDLKLGNKVLFSGTPCQVAGLRSFVGKKYAEKLYTIDLVCHAVPSPKIWEEYVKWVEEKYGEKIVKVNFRNKKFGWHSHFETFLTATREIKRNTFRFFFFYKHLSVRTSCSNCSFTNLKRIGDVTVGDFWGWEKFHKDWNDNLGVSLVMLNSQKGCNLFQAISNKVFYLKSNSSECMQPQLSEPIQIDSLQNEFIDDFKNKGLDYIMHKKKYFKWPRPSFLSYMHILRVKLGILGKPLHWIKKAFYK